MATLFSILLATLWTSSSSSGAAQIPSARPAPPRATLSMSHMGQRARRALRDINRTAGSGVGTSLRSLAFKEPLEPGDEEEEGGGPGGLEDGGELPGGNQGELSIAIDDSGRHIVVGFNDAAWFFEPPTVPPSLSGSCSPMTAARRSSSAAGSQSRPA